MQEGVMTFHGFQSWILSSKHWDIVLTFYGIEDQKSVNKAGSIVVKPVKGFLNCREMFIPLIDWWLVELGIQFHCVMHLVPGI